MTNRREFLQYTGMAALATSTPILALAKHHEQLSKRKIPGSDEYLPVIGLGNSNSFRQQDLSVASRLIDVFLEHGGRYVDVGGSSRFSVGQLAREKGASDQLFMGNYLDPKEGQDLADEVKAVAAGQGKSALDLVHSRDLAGYRRQIADYRRLKDDGLVRYIGIARSGRGNHEAIMRLIEDGLVDFVQSNYSLLEPEAGDRLLPLARDKGVAMNINRPFINGDYFSIVRGQKLPEWAAEFDCHSWAQFSLKFILSHPAVNCVLTETSKPKHALDNLGAGLGRLPDKKAQQRMLKLIRGLR